VPKFLEDKLKAEYGADNPGAVYGTMNAIGAMHGNKTTPKGEAMQAKHDADQKKARSSAKGKKYKLGKKPPARSGRPF
jgi:hypothetical protein